MVQKKKITVNMNLEETCTYQFDILWEISNEHFCMLFYLFLLLLFLLYYVSLLFVMTFFTYLDFFIIEGCVVILLWYSQLIMFCHSMYIQISFFPSFQISFLCCFSATTDWISVIQYKEEMHISFSCPGRTIQVSYGLWLVIHYVYRVSFVFVSFLSNCLLEFYKTHQYQEISISSVSPGLTIHHLVISPD